MALPCGSDARTHNHARVAHGSRLRSVSNGSHTAGKRRELAHLSVFPLKRSGGIVRNFGPADHQSLRVDCVGRAVQTAERA